MVPSIYSKTFRAWGSKRGDFESFTRMIAVPDHIDFVYDIMVQVCRDYQSRLFMPTIYHTDVVAAILKDEGGGGFMMNAKQI
jgi:hypothetical protein